MNKHIGAYLVPCPALPAPSPQKSRLNRAEERRRARHPAPLIDYYAAYYAEL